MMRDRSFTLASRLAVAAVLATVSAASAADGSIAGTVKVTGQPTSADVLVYIQQAPGTFAPPPKPVEIDQRGKEFIPRVLPVVSGSTVRFLNNDPTRHNVRSPDYEKYNLGNWNNGQFKDYVYDKCKTFPCPYTQLCSLHPNMYAYVVVLQNPFFGVSTSEGRFKIDAVPAGDYTLAVWHARMKAPPQQVKVVAGKPTSVDFVLAR